jgi:hypothetical protein
MDKLLTPVQYNIFKKNGVGEKIYFNKNGYGTKFIETLGVKNDQIYGKIIPDPIKFTFWGGFAVDADFSDGFSGCIEGPFFGKNHNFR